MFYTQNIKQFKNKLFGNNFFILNISKSAFQIWMKHKISNKIMNNTEFFKMFFWGLAVISPKINRQFATVWTILKHFFLLQYLF